MESHKSSSTHITSHRGLLNSSFPRHWRGITAAGAGTAWAGTACVLGEDAEAQVKI